MTGTDEHGEKIALAAANRGLSPQDHCDGIVAEYKSLWEKASLAAVQCAVHLLGCRASHPAKGVGVWAGAQMRLHYQTLRAVLQVGVHHEPRTRALKLIQTVSLNWRVYAQLDISYDSFVRTTDGRHEALVTEFLERVWQNGDIYKSDYEGFYCVDCEEYKVCPRRWQEALVNGGSQGACYVPHALGTCQLLSDGIQCSLAYSPDLKRGMRLRDLLSA